MTTVISGSSPSITFSDSTTQTTAFTSTPSVTTITTTSDATISGLTVGKGGGAVSTSTAVGASALTANTTGGNNVAIGYQAGLAQSTGGQSTFVGSQAGLAGADIDYATAVGYQAMSSITTGDFNTALGAQALKSNTTASNNTAVGYQAGYSNTTGSGENTYIGRGAGYTSTGAYNTCVGAYAGYYLTTGTNNTFIGPSGSHASGQLITTGSKNSILGAYDGNQGGLDIRTTNNYIVLSDGDGNPRGGWAGAQFFTGGTDYTMSSTNYGVALFASNGAQIRYNNDGGTTDANAVVGRNQGTDKIYIKSSNGAIQNSTNSYGGISDLRLKENITDATPKLSELQQVRIVNFNLINDTKKEKQIGVIAQELEQVFPSMVDTSVDKDDEGNDLGTTTKTVKYSVFVPILVKAIQELKTIVDAQATKLDTVKAELAALKG